jgi:hypothetical protein
MSETGLRLTHTLNDAHTWNVTFVNDYATIITTVTAEYDDAIEVAQNLLQNHYGLSLDGWQAEFELAKWGEQ